MKEKDIQALRDNNGFDENIVDVTSFEDLPESMQVEFSDGKGGED